MGYMLFANFIDNKNDYNYVFNIVYLGIKMIYRKE